MDAYEIPIDRLVAVKRADGEAYRAMRCIPFLRYSLRDHAPFEHTADRETEILVEHLPYPACNTRGQEVLSRSDFEDAYELASAPWLEKWRKDHFPEAEAEE